MSDNRTHICACANLHLGIPYQLGLVMLFQHYLRRRFIFVMHKSKTASMRGGADRGQEPQRAKGRDALSSLTSAKT